MFNQNGLSDFDANLSKHSRTRMINEQKGLMYFNLVKTKLAQISIQNPSNFNKNVSDHGLNLSIHNQYGLTQLRYTDVRSELSSLESQSKLAHVTSIQRYDWRDEGPK